MVKIILTCQGAAARAGVEGVITAGAVGIPVEIVTDARWDGLMKTLVCMSAGEKIPVPGVEDRAVLPWEVLIPGMTLYLGLEGRDADGSVVIPTTWADCGRVRAGAEGSHVGAKPTPGEIDQILTVLAQTRAIAQSLREDADSHRFDGEPGRAPRLGENGTWWVWQIPEQRWVDTGVPARGEKGDKGDAYIITDEDKQEIAADVERRYTAELAQTRTALAAAEAELAEQSDINRAQSRALENLQAAAGGNLYRVEEDAVPAYRKEVPADALPAASLDSFGGRTLVRNQGYAAERIALGASGGTSSVDGGTHIYRPNSDVTGRYQFNFQTKNSNSPFRMVTGHKYLVDIPVNHERPELRYFAVTVEGLGADAPALGGSGTWQLPMVGTGAQTGTLAQIIMRQAISGTVTFTAGTEYTFTPVLYDLTQWFGADIAQTITTPQQAYALGIPRTPMGYDPGTEVGAEVVSVETMGINLCRQIPLPVSAAVRNDLSRYTWIEPGTYRLSVESFRSSTGSWAPALYFRNREGGILPGVSSLQYNTGSQCCTLGRSITELTAVFTVYDACYVQFALLQGQEVQGAMLTKGTALYAYAPCRAERKEIPAALRALPGYGRSGAAVDIGRGEYIDPEGNRTDIRGMTAGLSDLTVEPGGTITFEQAAGQAVPVPNRVSYLIKLGGNA